MRRSKLPWSLINKLVRKGLFKVDGHPLESSYRLKEKDLVQFPGELEFSKPVLYPEFVRTFEKWVVHEDDQIIAINKPDGIASQGGTGVKISVDAIADQYCNAKLMHRIDKKVSGVLLLAKNAQACTIPIENKQYYAIVIGKTKQSGIITDKILTQDPIQKIHIDGKDAITHYETIETVFFNNLFYSLLKIWIDTGRKHQIRVHCAQSLSVPVLGDEKYGGGVKPRIFLHAYSCFANRNLIVAPVPDNFCKEMSDLGFKTII